MCDPLWTRIGPAWCTFVFVTGYALFGPGESSVFTELVENVKRAKSPYELGMVYDDFFESVEDDQLASLRGHDDDGIALRANWEMVRRSIPRKVPAEGVIPDNDRLQRFAGVLEGRLRTTLPGWWERTLLHAHARKNGERLLFTFPATEFPPDKQLDSGFTAPADIIVKGQHGPTFVKIGNWLRCVNTHDSQQVLWMAGLWESRLMFNGSGNPGRQVVEVTADARYVFVFGASRDHVDVQVFSLEDGASLVRFSTTY
jgi:hypothetical protein